ncbi:hypothetical protein [Caldisericum sp.]|uniref:hypothetical protein n=1 Tax=Caldisericum sp. TaxID=2499687 RepID=UPI003D0B1287
MKVKDNIIIAFENDEGVYLATYNKNLDPIGRPTFAKKGKDNIFLATDEEEKIWITSFFLLKIK